MSSKRGGLIGLCIVVGYSFQTYWLLNEEKVMSVGRNKNILAVVLMVCCFLGVAMTASGISNLQGIRLKYDFTPISKHARHNYLLLTIVGFLYIIAAIFGYFGVCERKHIFAKAYMMLCLGFGLGLLLLYFNWLILDHILIPNFEVTDNGIEKLVLSPYEVRVARYYMTFMLLSAILQIACGILIFLVLFKYRKIRGYIELEESEPDFTVILDLLRTRHNVHPV